MPRMNEESAASGPREVVLHIGLHKTGSTSIQESLKRAQSDHILRGAIYLQSAPSNHSYVMAPAFGSPRHRSYYRRIKFGGRVPLNSMDPDAARELVSVGIEEAAAVGVPLVISAEDLCCLTPEEVRGLKTYLDQQDVVRTKVVVYVRPIEAWANSYAAQLVKQGLRTIQEVLEDPPYPRYREFLEKYSEAFGASAMTIRPLDRAALAGGSVLRDFLHLAAPSHSNDSVEELRRNVSPSLDQLRLVSRFTEVVRANKLRINIKKMQSHLNRFHAENGDVAFALPRETLDRIQEMSGPDVQWLMENSTLERDFLEESSGHVPEDVLRSPVRDVDFVTYIAALA